MNKKIAFIGGDHRQTVALSILSEKYEVAAFGFDSVKGELGGATRCSSVADAVANADAVVLPLPYTRDKLHVFAPLFDGEILLEDVFSVYDSNSRLFGGMLDSYITNRVRNAVDYYTSEELQIMNSVPTAEGAIAIAMEELPITLFGANSLVLGFGRVSKILANRLYSLGSTVTVCARREDDRAYAKAFGYNCASMEDLPRALSEADVVFNSIPHHIITPELFSKVKKGAPIIDLASRPGGLDFEKAKQFGLNVIWALSLPGKVAPVTSGKIIANTLINEFTEVFDNE